MVNIKPLTRDNISLDTGGLEYYDDICALSAETINNNFEILFRRRPEIKELVYNDGDATTGTLKATLKAPRILIEPNQELSKNPEIYFSLIVDKGRIYYPGSQTITIDGWVITVAASLNRMIASPADHMDDKIRYSAQDALDEILQTHEIPEPDPKNPVKMRAGEYSIHRLFAAISETAWMLPDPDRSTVPIGPRGMTLAEWEEQSYRNHTMASKVKGTLRSWAADHEYSAFFTLGLEVSVPDPIREAKERPTFLPTSLRLQNYPFIDDSDYINFVDAGETPRGIVDNKWNCLVFCEKCDNRRPPGKALIPYMGNLAMPKNPANGNSKAVCGTFAMDGRLFFNEYLLPELREFCIGSQIIPLRPKMYTDPNLSGTRACISSPVIACGVVPSNLSTEERKALTFIPPSSANNNYYDFAKTGPLSWEWHTKLTAPGSRSKVHYYGNGTPPGQPIYRKYTTESEMSVRVRGKPGSSVIAVEGGNEYRHWEGYYNNDSFDWNSRAGTDVVLWGKFAITSRWSVEINLSPEGETSHCGIVSPVIQGIDNNTWLPINMNVRVTDECYNISNSHKDMERDIYESMSRSLEVVNQTLQKKFQSAGRFIYPGVGTLSFGGMKLSESGNVYCDVDYIPPNPGPIKLLVPDSRFPYSKEFKRDSNARDIPGAPPSSGNIPRIKWTPAIKYDPITRRAKLTLIAQNALKQAAAFSNIKVILSQVKSLDSYGLFSEETWENKEDVLKRQEERRKKKEEEEERKKREQKGREKKTRERDNAKPSDARAVEDIKDDIGEHERKTVEETIIIEPESKPDKRPAAKSEPESESESEPGQETGSETEPELEPDEEPSQTWLLKYQGVFSAYVDRLYVKPDVVGQNHVILFSVLPDGEFPPTRKKRFIFSKDENASSFTLELEGKVRRPGKYVLQLSESWSVPNVMNNPTKTELSDSWFTVLIDETNRTGQFERVTQKEAEKIQGVKV